MNSPSVFLLICQGLIGSQIWGAAWSSYEAAVGAALKYLSDINLDVKWDKKNQGWGLKPPRGTFILGHGDPVRCTLYIQEIGVMPNLEKRNDILSINV
jgi:hypothetical protein